MPSSDSPCALFLRVQRVLPRLKAGWERGGEQMSPDSAHLCSAGADLPGSVPLQEAACWEQTCVRRGPVQVCQRRCGVVWCGVAFPDGCTRRRELQPTFSIWSASRRSLASLRLGLNVSGSSSALIDVPCLELTSSLVVIYKNGTHLYIYKSNKKSLPSKRKSNIELYRLPQPAYRHE